MQPIDRSNFGNIIRVGEKPNPNLPPLSPHELKEPPRYLLCNETGQAETLRTLTENYSEVGGTHVGFALWMNLDIISITKAEQAIIADFDPEITSTLELVKESVLRSDTREAFVENFIDALKALPDTPDPFLILGRTGGMNEEAFKKEITGQGWLSSDEQYSHVRDLYSQGKIHHAKADITDPEFFSQVKNWVAKTNSRVSTAYSSNICEWIKQNKGNRGLDRLAHNFREILDAESLYIDAQRQTNIGGESPKQRTTMGCTLPKVSYRPVKRSRGHFERPKDTPPTNLLF